MKRAMQMSLSQVLHANHNDLSDHDLAHLADWASSWKDLTPNPSWKRAYALIREGADMLLRRRAMSTTAELENHVGQTGKREELPPDLAKADCCWQESYMKRGISGVYAVNNHQGWMILEPGSLLNIACGSDDNQKPRFDTEEEAWTAAYAVRANRAKSKQLRKWPEAHAVMVGQLGWIVLGTADVADTDAVAYRYPLAISHNCSFMDTEAAAWLDADERDAKGHPTWSPNRATGSTRDTDEHNAAVDARSNAPKSATL